MIEVNLLPGGKKKRPSKGGGGGGGFLRKLSLPSLGSLSLDAYTIASVVVVAGVLAALGWGYVGVSSRQEDVAVALADAIEDSSDYADLIERNVTLEARRDSVAQKVSIIQDVDALRYVWPHLMDEVARALPDYTWLTELIQVSAGETVDFQIRGLAANNPAMTRFMRQLEDSPFIRNVDLVESSEQIVPPTGQRVVAFQLDCVYARPPLDVLETIPLFGVDPPAVNE